jgi:hypothetical protein
MTRSSVSRRSDTSSLQTSTTKPSARFLGSRGCVPGPERRDAGSLPTAPRRLVDARRSHLCTSGVPIPAAHQTMLREGPRSAVGRTVCHCEGLVKWAARSRSSFTLGSQPLREGPSPANILHSSRKSAHRSRRWNWARPSWVLERARDGLLNRAKTRMYPVSTVA